MIKNRKDLVFIVIIVVLYTISLFLPALHYLYTVSAPRDHTATVYGYQLLITQPWVLGVFVLWFAGYANPLLFYSLFRLYKKHYKAAAQIAAVACLFGLQTLTIYIFGPTPSFDGFPSLQDPGLGYFLWQLVLLIAAVYTYVRYSNEKKNTAVPFAESSVPSITTDVPPVPK